METKETHNAKNIKNEKIKPERKKLNIGFFIDTYYPMIDGVITVVHNYARLLSDFANVTVFAPTIDKNYNDNDLPYKVVRCKSFKVPFLDYSVPTPNRDKNFKKSISEAKLDIIHIHSPFYVGRMGAKYGKAHNIPVIATLHSNFKKDFKRAVKLNLITKLMLKYVAKSFNYADILTTMNPSCEKMAREYGCKSKIILIPNGCDLYPTEKIEEKAKEIRQKYAQEDEKLFVSCGRISKLKNIKLSIETIKYLNDLGFKAKLIIIGFGKEESYFRKLIKKLDIKDKIIFVGKIFDKDLKSAYYKCADLHLFPSYYDTDGIVRIEASAMEVPTLFCENSFASSVCTDNINGYIAPNNVEKYANKIIQIFKNESNYKKVCQNCRKDLFISWNSVVDKVKEMYNEILGEKKNG